MSLVFTPVRAKQAAALGRLAKIKDAPKVFVVAVERENDGNMVVVPSSNKDPRRWDISKGGAIVRSVR